MSLVVLLTCDCDISLQVTFIVTPAIMLYSLGFRTPVDQVVLVFWVLCGVARLARFNVSAHLVPKDKDGRALYHVGLAVPYAALIVSTAVAVSAWLEWTSKQLLLYSLLPSTLFEFHPTLVPVVALGAMMTSKRLKIKFDGGISIPAISVVIFGSCWSYSH
jgi:CDP-diacylglycerol---serine O-phosphatidyltransferase